MVFSLIDYDQAFDSVDRRALATALSFYGIPEKYITVICAMYENNTTAVKKGNEIRKWFCIKSGAKQGCVLPPFIWIILMQERQLETTESNGEGKSSWTKITPMI